MASSSNQAQATESSKDVSTTPLCPVSNTPSSTGRSETDKISELQQMVASLKSIVEHLQKEQTELRGQLCEKHFHSVDQSPGGREFVIVFNAPGHSLPDSRTSSLDKEYISPRLTRADLQEAHPPAQEPPTVPKEQHKEDAEAKRRGEEQRTHEEARCAQRRAAEEQLRQEQQRRQQQREAERRARDEQLKQQAQEIRYLAQLRAAEEQLIQERLELGGSMSQLSDSELAARIPLQPCLNCGGAHWRKHCPRRRFR